MKVSVNISAMALAIAIGPLVNAGVKADDVVVKHSNDLLRSIYNDYMAAQGDVGGSNNSTDEADIEGSTNMNDFLVWKEDNGTAKLVVTVIAQGEGAAALLLPAFDAYGFESTGCSTYQCSGFLPIENFEGFEARPEVRAIRPTFGKANQAGSKVSEAVVSLGVDKVRAADPSLTGAGLKIGILSDSFNVLGGYADDVASKDLPANVVILKEYSGDDGIDEGRAMAQLIHDIAPGAQMLFHTAVEGAASFADGIQKLADAGCNVIVDDIYYFDDPFFLDGVIAQSATDAAKLKGAAYFSAAGNDAAQSWEGTFKGSGAFDVKGCELHNFATEWAVSNTRQKITTLDPGLVISFQWDDPFFSVSGPPGVTRDMDIRLYEDGVLVTPTVGVSDDTGLDAVILVDTGSPGTYEIEISLCTLGAPPPRIKWMGFVGRMSDIEFGTSSSTCFGHPNAPYVAGVGAANFPDTPAFNGGKPPRLARYSSLGGLPIYFDRTGARLALPEDRLQPLLVATDRVINTFFGRERDLPPNGPGFYFGGTSAAAPNAAAVACLMLQVNPKLKPLEVYDILAKTAIEMGALGWDRYSGAGYVNGTAAVNMVKFQKSKKKAKSPKSGTKAPKSTSVKKTKAPSEPTRKPKTVRRA